MKKLLCLAVIVMLLFSACVPAEQASVPLLRVNVMTDGQKELVECVWDIEKNTIIESSDTLAVGKFHFAAKWNGSGRLYMPTGLTALESPAMRDVRYLADDVELVPYYVLSPIHHNWTINNSNSANDAPIDSAPIVLTGGDAGYEFDFSGIGQYMSENVEDYVIGGLCVSGGYANFLLFPLHAAYHEGGVYVIRAALDGGACEVLPVENVPQWSIVDPPIWSQTVVADDGFIVFDYYGAIYKIKIPEMTVEKLLESEDSCVSQLGYYNGYVLSATKPNTESETITYRVHKDGEVLATQTLDITYLLPCA